ncbi:MAG TPA: DUF4232 domain-containing protein [Pyrinomonadaceae bacterium]|nr:DUF4232 domain-containing protein [Pyrinomonadaceae bacterium]
MRVAILLTLLAAASSVAAGQPQIEEIAYLNSAIVDASVPCRGEDLSVRPVADDAAMGGHNLIDYAFRNKSASPCTLKGYPRYVVVGSVRESPPRRPRDQFATVAGRRNK